MSISQERSRAVAETMDAVRRIEAAGPIDRDGLARATGALLELAAQRALFPLEDFPAPAAGIEDHTALYRLAEDGDHRHALYLQACRPGLDVPPHNHTTWAVIVGLDGREENRLYRRTPGAANTPPEETERINVEAGGSVAMLADDVHSIHIHGAPVWNFHMYGHALDRLDRREYWSAKKQAWKVFPLLDGIIDRRDA